MNNINNHTNAISMINENNITRKEKIEQNKNYGNWEPRFEKLYYKMIQIHNQKPIV